MKLIQAISSPTPCTSRPISPSYIITCMKFCISVFFKNAINIFIYTVYVQMTLDKFVH